MPEIKKRDIKDKPGRDLRAAAEKEAARSSGASRVEIQLAPDELIHELEVQNEEPGKTPLAIEDILANQDRARLVLLSILEDEKIARRVLHESEEKYRALIETAPCIICSIHLDGTTVFVNPYIKVMTGYDADEIIGRNWWDIFYPGELHVQAANLLEAVKSGDVHGYEMTLTASDGSFKTIQWDSFNKYGTDGALIEINGVGIDITDRMRAEELVRHSLREKEILLREIHHRVKNNLQVISSLVGLQSYEIKDRSVLNALMNIQNRIKSMAIIHEKLYRSDDLAKIEMREYVASISGNLFQSYGIDQGRVSCVVDINDIYLGLESAVPCGLIVTELITNALKHAFPGESKGEIVIGMMRDGVAGDLVLFVRDNGAGMSEEVDIESAKTLGLRMVGVLVKQLNGTSDVGRGGGVEFIIRFRENQK